MALAKWDLKAMKFCCFDIKLLSDRIKHGLRRVSLRKQLYTHVFVICSTSRFTLFRSKLCFSKNFGICSLVCEVCSPDDFRCSTTVYLQPIQFEHRLVYCVRPEKTYFCNFSDFSRFFVVENESRCCQDIDCFRAPAAVAEPGQESTENNSNLWQSTSDLPESAFGRFYTPIASSPLRARLDCINSTQICRPKFFLYKMGLLRGARL